MRRPLLIIFIFIIFITFLCTSHKPLDKSHDNKIVTIEGIVKDKIEKERYNQYKIGKFLVNDYSKKKKLKIGQNIKITGKYKSLDNMKFKDFDYGKYVKSTGYQGIIYIKEYQIKDNDKLYTYIGEVKEYIRNTLRYLYKKNSDFINSILLGETSNLTQDEKDMFSRTGTSHVIAISGLHTGILCAMIAFLIRGINKFYKLVILSITIILYCIMVGSSPSIIRSIGFIIILYLAVFLDKKRDGISTLSLLGIFLIINNPYIIYNLSFQLSFLATLSIIYFYIQLSNTIEYFQSVYLLFKT